MPCPVPPVPALRALWLCSFPSGPAVLGSGHPTGLGELWGALSSLQGVKLDHGDHRRPGQGAELALC